VTHTVVVDRPLEEAGEILEMLDSMSGGLGYVLDTLDGKLSMDWAIRRLHTSFRRLG